MRKRVIAVLMIVGMIFGLVACGSDGPGGAVGAVNRR